MTNSKYPPELRERATRLAVEARRDPDTRNGPIARIANHLDVHSQALRNWVPKAEADQVPVAPVDAADRLRTLEKENRELRRSHEILKSAAAFVAAEFDRPSR
ncbi:MAG: transposase [Acidipropionibacterium sp.]|jgi:transposase|nr:transposase [Acidipropionibacterium sp.]